MVTILQTLTEISLQMQTFDYLEHILVTSIFSFPHDIFKGLLYKGREKSGTKCS